MRLRGQVDDLRREARHDGLTGLLNRRGLIDALTLSSPGWSLLFLDLDAFKSLNDQRGHAAGDRILCDLAAILADFASIHGAYAARIGGDEFVVIVPGSGAQFWRARLVRALANGLSARVSVGASEWAPGQSLACAIDASDQAMYAAKRHSAGAGVSEISIYEIGDPHM